MAFLTRKYLFLKALLPAFFVVLIFFTSCGVRRTIPKGEHLLKKNTVKLIKVHKEDFQDKAHYKKSKVRKNEISPQILHRANKRVIFSKVPIYLWMYALGTKKRHPELSDSSKWRRKMRYELGEAPVLIDSTLVKLSEENIRTYLFNKGFLDAKVESKVKYTRRKAKVRYYVYPGQAYLVNSVFMRPADTMLRSLLDTVAQHSEYFREWWPLDINKLNTARTYLTRVLRDSGYYLVKPEFIHYLVDTFYVKKEAQVILVLSNFPGQTHFSKFTFANVTVDIEKNPKYNNTRNPQVVQLRGKTLRMNKYPLDANTLARLIYLDSGSFFSQTAIEKTYQSLVQMGLFSIVDIQFSIDSVHKTVKTKISLKTQKRMSFSIEPQGLYSPQGTSGTNFQTSSQRSFGLAGILSFNNRNAFHHGENFRLSSVTSYEAIIKNDKASNPLYGLQQGFNASLTLPHFNLLNKLRSFNSFTQRNTVFSLSYQYEKNPNFLRSAFPASLTFQFVKPKLSWYYTPAEISFNKNKLSAEFEAQLPPADLAFIQRVFTNQLVSASKVGLIFVNNRTKPGETYIFTHAGFETSGNLHRAIRKYTDKQFNQDSTYSLFGLQYFQYVKMEGEIRLRRTFDVLNSAAMRVHSGIAIPYGNSNFVPYDKRYFIGGSNSIRGWRPRRLGPGSTPDTILNIIDRSGEFLFEANVEYRFTAIRNFLELAIFLDAGNIWNINRKNQTADPRGILYEKKFLDQMALNTGLGFRFDFKIFLFRLDWGIPLHDPSKGEGHRWLVTRSNFTDPWTFTRKETALVIGIGYPF